MTIEGEIARALVEHGHVYDSDCGVDFGCLCGAIDEYKSSDEHADHLAEVLAPLLNRVRAEALREARYNVRASSFWADGSDNYADRVRGYLSNAADRIEQNSEGNEA